MFITIDTNNEFGTGYAWNYDDLIGMFCDPETADFARDLEDEDLDFIFNYLEDSVKSPVSDETFATMIAIEVRIKKYTYEYDELDMVTKILEDGYTLDDFKYDKIRYNYFKTFMEEHGLI